MTTASTYFPWFRWLGCWAGGAAALICAATAATQDDAALAGEPLTLQRKLDILMSSYPGAIVGARDGHLVMRNEMRILIDDGKSKSHEQKLADGDIEDMLGQIYPLASCASPAPPRERNFEPGRIRSERFFRALYGATADDVRQHLTSIEWFGKRMSVTRKFGVADKLLKIREELRALGPTYSKYLRDSAGAFNWRPIAGTNRLSTHSFGTAIDINVSQSGYWRWSGGKPGNVRPYRNRIPAAIVAVFERHGFIWGGNWYHYDTMHFEYRPELIAIARQSATKGCGR